MFAEDLLREVRRAGYTLSAFLAYGRAIVSRVVRRLPLHAELVRSIAATSMLLFAAQFAGALALSATIGRGVAVSYLLASSGVLLAATFWLLAHVGLAQGRDEGPLFRRVPIPVTLTVLRLVSIPAIVLLIRDGWWGAATWLFVASALTDVLDGVLARAMGQESHMGKVLDPMADIVFNSSVFVAIAAAGALPWWVTGLFLARYALLVGGTFYLYVFHGPVRIEPTLFGKVTGVVTTTIVGLLLLGLAVWTEAVRQQFHEVFVVGLATLGVATIIQVVFIGLGNKKAAAAAPEVEASEKVVGDVRYPRR